MLPYLPYSIQGVDLRVYARQIEDDMRIVEGKSVEDYVRESRSMAKLFNQVDMCDNMLRDMEQTLKVGQGMGRV